VIDQWGPARSVSVALGLMGISMLLWPLGTQLWSLWLVCLPWALSAFAVNSAQQARLGQMSPTLATALLSLNTSAIYSGHALGAGGGSWALGQWPDFAALHWLALGWLGLAVLTSIRAARQ
jgi:DHA1 family inner membrane transport protein